MTHALVEHFFRHEYGRLVAGLCRAVGVGKLDRVEDAVQAALVQAMRSWSLRGVPDDPAGWLYRVARNRLTDAARRDQRWAAVARRVARPVDAVPEEPTADPDADLLRLLFACCHPELPPESQIAIALKTLCGFSVEEIARGLLTTPANVARRISRAKEKLRDAAFDPSEPTDQHSRVEAVRQVVYLLFNEGYHSAHSNQIIRRDLCDEAIRLGRLLATDPASCALISLMLMQASRFDARLDAGGRLLLLDEQDRSLWDRQRIADGLHWLERSAAGDTLSRYHIEAGIAAAHARAATFADTNWPAIVHLYEMLLRLDPAPVHFLNAAAAIAHHAGPAAGLDVLGRVPKTDIPAGYYLWDAVAGELHRRAGNASEARSHLTTALAAATVAADRELIGRRLQLLDADSGGRT